MAVPSHLAPQPTVQLDRLTEVEMVALLASGQHAVPLRALFGETPYEELRKLAKKVLALRKRARSSSSKTRVYLLPGIMGSTLAWPRKSAQHNVWLNPQAIAAGELLSLALPAKPDLQPLGVMLPGYLKLKLHLMLAGFDTVFHPFDWRKSVVSSGKLLLQRIASDGVKNALLVGHSMGGLVARAALAKDKQLRIARIVQLGAPNFGSYAMVQALRGAYPTVRKVAALDPLHSTDQLVRHVFRTLPGFYELLPAPAHSSDLDLLQLSNWPDDLLGPDATLLGAAVTARAQLGAAHQHCYHIVGVDQETATQVRKRRSGFEYGITRDGDGTVPRALAEWPDATNYYAQERHGNLTNNSTVCLAVVDLLTQGATRKLPTECQSASRQVTRWVSDAQLRTGHIGGRNGKVAWEELPLEERRRILEPVISPEFHELAATN